MMYILTNYDDVLKNLNKIIHYHFIIYMYVNAIGKNI